jgi:hypothetical protein
MNKLPKEKRDKLILVVISTIMLIALIYFGWIRSQDSNISRIKVETAAARDQLLGIESAIKKSDSTQVELFDIAETLSHAEDDMASGDTFAWTYDTIRHFKTAYKVEIPTIGSPATGDVDLLANFPYKQLKFNISGTAYYHDLGKFVSDFENNFPHIRIVNLNLDPAGGTGEDGEKLAFRMDIVALIKPNVASK